MTPLVQFHPPSHGPCRAAYEGEPTLNRTMLLALVIATVFVLGVSLIVRGLM